MRVRECLRFRFPYGGSLLPFYKPRGRVGYPNEREITSRKRRVVGIPLLSFPSRGPVGPVDDARVSLCHARVSLCLHPRDVRRAL
jgi:hypothetical protein